MIEKTPLLHPSIWLLVDSRDIGGIETHLLMVSQGLKRQGFLPEIIFWADYGPHPLVPSLTEAQIPYRSLQRGFRDLLRFLHQERPAILHTHGYKANLLGRIAARLTCIPIIATYHTGNPSQGMVRLYTGLDLMTARLAPRLAVSAAIAQTLPKPVTVLPNFVTLPPLESLSDQRHDAFGFVGRLSHEKGPDLFCDLAARMPNHRFTLYGDGPMGPELRATYPNGPVFKGRVVPMVGHWGELDLLIMSSRHEGLPLAALEAMAHGIPVAAFAVGGLTDLIRHGHDGFLAPANDLAALAGCLETWTRFSPQQKTAMRAAARRKIEQSYSLESGTAALCTAYRAAGAKI